MAQNYFIEYTNFIDDVQNKLMKIQLRFNECLNNIRNGIGSGTISLEEGERLLSQRMDMYYDNITSKYRLSKEDVEFVRKYADLDKHGQLLATFLKREYLDKKDKLTAILESVKVYGYLDSLSSEDARLHVKVAMHDCYNNQLKNIEYKMNSLLQIYGDNERHSSRYLELEIQEKKLKRVMEIIGNLEKVPDETFDKIVSQFYHVQRKYYDWFLKMQIKQEYEVGSVYQEHCDTMRSIDSTGIVILTASDSLTKLNKELDDMNKGLFNALIGISSFDINGILALHEKPKKRSLKKVEENNREFLLDVFINLMSVNGINIFAADTFGNGDSSINLNSSFYAYFNSKYGSDIRYLDPNIFIADLRNDIVLYYKGKIKEIVYKINQQTVKINSNTTLMCGNIKVGMNQANLQKSIREQYPAKREELLISGFSFDELERIYTDLKEFIGNGFSFGADDVELFFRKV